MLRTCACSLAGGVVGFMAGIVLVMIASGGEWARDTAFMILVIGAFLAGTGAVAGAVIGGVVEIKRIIHNRPGGIRPARNEI